ncbi:MAG: hypothetical protein MPK11_03070 [Gammaproteobacteria bacterium]|nr:hypothetical protein [Gammaproteobacteria bacterium]CAJ2376481.1 MAG: conserved hypothetical protein [Arenicellales bacterium IbO2]MDA7961559.1 hypothetical protein [Gammaproteobacteria bacterium]MDA7967528.1 hypothetical protein [Gammaproteobacteria bacterium]MDA7969748.1 hypothetical protein [Gammaproteobacteria bacterium]
MKPAWDWPLLRRSANQAGVVAFAAGLAQAILGNAPILSSAILVVIGILLIILSIMRRYKMTDVVWVALLGAIPLIILMIIGLYYNR